MTRMTPEIDDVPIDDAVLPAPGRRLADRIEAEKAQRPGARADPRLAWWRAAGFGAFVHWGLYALPDRWADRPARADRWTQEWVQRVRRVPCDQYARLADDFVARGFDAHQWVRTFQRAGQRYLVVTAKHHDGFCLFRSAHTRFNVADATPLGRDVVGELADACRDLGMPFGVYYSQTQDWRHPDGHGNDWDYDPAVKDFDRYLREYVEPQVTELLTRYGPVAVMWFDTPMIMTRGQSERLLGLVHRLQPACLVNGRIGHGLGDYATTRDNQFLTGRPDMDWECPATMNDTWGYRAADTDWKPADRLLADLRDVRAKGGNYLLNIGPDGEGVIPPAAAAALDTIGRELRHRPPAVLTPR